MKIDVGASPPRRGMPVAALTVILALASALPALADAQVYRWVDEDGNVHYSDEPRPDAERVDIETEPTDIEETLRRRVEMERKLELREQLRADQREDESAQAAHQAKVERACRQARERLKKIEPARRLVKRDDAGNIVDEYTVEERMAAVEEARQQVAEWCR